MTAGVALAGVELAQPACVEQGALTEPVLRIAECVDIQRKTSLGPEVKMGRDITATCPDALQQGGPNSLPWRVKTET